MSRRRRAEKREIDADLKFNNKLAAKIINNMMIMGKKSTASKIFYEAMEIIREKGQEPMHLLKKAMDNIKPMLEVKARRIGGATYQVPVDVRAERRVSLASRWLLDAAKARTERTMQNKLAAELLDAFNGRGAAIKKRDDMHRMAEANRAFVHFRW